MELIGKMRAAFIAEIERQAEGGAVGVVYWARNEGDPGCFTIDGTFDIDAATRAVMAVVRENE